jgi:hypothetical protein
MYSLIHNNVYKRITSRYCMVNGNYKDEYKSFLYVDNTMPAIDPEGYDAMNRTLFLHHANVRVGPPLGTDGKVTNIGIGLTCGLYMRAQDISDSRLPRRNLSLDQAMTEMQELF